DARDAGDTGDVRDTRGARDAGDSRSAHSPPRRDARRRQDAEERSQPDPRLCPRCGVPRGDGKTPACGCARQAADDARRTRSVEAAAAEDFNPLRIRPYVSLPDPDAAAPPGDTAPLSPAPPPPTRGPDAADVRLFPADPHEADAESDTYERAARRRRYALLAGAGAVAAVAAAAVFATGLLSSAADGTRRDHALPDAPTSAFADPTKPAPPSAKRSPSPSHTPSASPSATPSPTSSPTRPSRSPSTPPPTARATGSVGTPSAPPQQAAGATLREGDKGARVVELQGRLAQLYLYVGERDGAYTREVTDAVTRYQWARGLTDDPPGEYGRTTRRSLESETTEPTETPRP
ncbi:peptidoglycan-binding domain-containing protein, partial [Streptomyces silaceus]|uniref:peptidoglycan-binding domain-containing protein n=2 Tax=Streptomyces TaxID=1883 RepID=UPI000AC0E83A